MRGLIYKDLYLLRKSILPLAALMVYLMVTGVFMNHIAAGGIGGHSAISMISFIGVITIIMFSSTAQSSLIFQDEKRIWNSYTVSLPESVQGAVAAKYISIFIIAFATFVICYLYEIFCSFVMGSVIDRSFIYLGLILFQLFLRSIELPLAFLFGAKHAGTIRMIIVLSLVCISGVYALFGDVSWLMEGEGFAANIWNFISGISNEALEKYMEKLMLKAVILCGLIPHIIVAFYYISYRISCRLYVKGAQNYDD